MSNLALKLESFLKIASHLPQKLGGSLKTFFKQGNKITFNSIFARFLLVGLLNTIVGLTFMFLLRNGLSWPYWLATFSGNSLGAAVSFLMNRTFTFKSKVSIQKGGPRFLAVILSCYFFSYSISRHITGLLGNMEWWSDLITRDNLAILLGSGIYTVSNYYGQKRFVFNIKRN